MAIKFIACTFLAFLICSVTEAQFKIETITETNEYNDANYQFPIITDKSPAARRINDYLQLVALRLVVGKQDSIIFERDWPTKQNFHGRQFFEFEILENNAHLLVIETSYEWCSAYCEFSSSHYVFDAVNGNLVELSELFTKTGYEIYEEKVKAARRLRLQNEIIQTYQDEAELAQSIKEEARPEYAESMALDLDDMREERGIYEACILDIKEYPLYGSYYISERSIVSTRVRCSAHINQGLDNVGDFQDSLSFAEVAPLLSDYGKKLLLEEANTATSQALTGKVYQGLIADKYPIKLLLSSIDENNTVQGYYAYEKTGKAISLSGSIKDGLVTLTESDEEENNTGTLSFRFTDDRQRATGQWTSPQGKALSLELFNEK